MSVLGMVAAPKKPARTLANAAGSNAGSCTISLADRSLDSPKRERLGGAFRVAQLRRSGLAHVENMSLPRARNSSGSRL
jgi:hypothetical protein